VDATLAQPRLLWAARGLIHGGEVAGRYGIYNIALGTTHETAAARRGRPATRWTASISTSSNAMSRRSRGSWRRSATRTGAGGRVGAVADQRGLSLRRVIPADYSYINPRFRNDSAEGAMTMGRHRGSSIPNLPVPGAVVQVSIEDPWNRIFWPHNKYAAFDPFIVA
jgi:hypothetical protein